MSRVVVKAVRGVAYVQVVADYRKGEKWRQKTLASYGRLSPETHARAHLHAAMIDRLQAEAKGTILRRAMEAEVAHLIGGETINALRSVGA